MLQVLYCTQSSTSRLPVRAARHSCGAALLSLALAGCSVYNADMLEPERAPRAHIASGEKVFISDTCDAGASAACDSAVTQPVTEHPCDDAAEDDCVRAQAHEHAEPTPTPAQPLDTCPDDPNKAAPGLCGCGVTDTDSDGDGTADCSDGCPHDPKKTAAGMCGCGETDSDSDADGTVDCADACPKDPRKTSVGACGCGVSDADQDADATPDCLDACPQDPHKTLPGTCGCGVSDPRGAMTGEPACEKPTLLHRYRFDGSGTTLTDSIGSADGTIYGGGNAMLDSGMLTLRGDQGKGWAGEGYAALPTRVWQGLKSATFELWVTWRGKGRVAGSDWQRLFDFGDQVDGRAHSYLFLTPSGNGSVCAAFSLNDSDASASVSVTSGDPLPRDTLTHVAVVVDESAAQLTLYVDGVAQGSNHLPGKLANITASNLWLGRSNFTEDPALFGSLHEFRIYATALTAAQLQTSFAAGPDADLSQ